MQRPVARHEVLHGLHLQDICLAAHFQRSMALAFGSGRLTTGPWPGVPWKLWRERERVTERGVNHKYILCYIYISLI